MKRSLNILERNYNNLDSSSSEDESASEISVPRKRRKSNRKEDKLQKEKATETKVSPHFYTLEERKGDKVTFNSIPKGRRMLFSKKLQLETIDPKRFEEFDEKISETKKRSLIYAKKLSKIKESSDKLDIFIENFVKTSEYRTIFPIVEYMKKNEHSHPQLLKEILNNYLSKSGIDASFLSLLESPLNDSEMVEYLRLREYKHNSMPYKFSYYILCYDCSVPISASEFAYFLGLVSDESPLSEKVKKYLKNGIGKKSQVNEPPIITVDQVEAHPLTPDLIVRHHKSIQVSSGDNFYNGLISNTRGLIRTFHCACVYNYVAKHFFQHSDKDATTHFEKSIRNMKLKHRVSNIVKNFSKDGKSRLYCSRNISLESLNEHYVAKDIKGFSELYQAENYFSKGFDKGVEFFTDPFRKKQEKTYLNYRLRDLSPGFDENEHDPEFELGDEEDENCYEEDEFELATPVFTSTDYLKDVKKFFKAIREGRNDKVKKFLEDEIVPVNVKDEEGCSALIVAVQCGHESIVRTLLEKGCNPEMENSNGETAMQIALNERKYKILELLSVSANSIEKEEKNENGHGEKVKRIANTAATTTTTTISFTPNEEEEDVEKLKEKIQNLERKFESILGEFRRVVKGKKE